MTEALPMPRWKPAVWATGQLAVQIYRDLPSLLLLYYMTQVLVVPPALAGVAIFVPKLIWAVGCDYAVGAWLDKMRGRVARRILLLIGAVLLPVMLIAVFTPFPSDSATVRALYVSACMAGYMTVFSIFSVPHLSIGAELAPDQRGQSIVMGWRTMVLGLGILIGGGLGPWIVQAYDGKAVGYQVMAFVMAAICSVSLVVSYFGSHEPAGSPPAPIPGGKWRALAANTKFLYVLAAFFALMVGQGTCYATYSYLVVFRLALDQPFLAMGISTMMVTISMAAIQPLLVRLTARYGALRVFVFGSGCYAVSLACIAYGPVGSELWFYIASFGLGLSNAAILQSAYTRLSELIADDAATNPGQSNAGFYSSLFVAGDKIAFGLGGTLLAGTLLSLVGFHSGGTVQTSGAIHGIAMIYAFTPIIFSALAIYLMQRSAALPATAPSGSLQEVSV